jgi:hypothetical protein
MARITLPRLIGSREAADDLLDSVAASLQGSELVVDCTELLSSSVSFADQLVYGALQQHGAAAIVLLSPPPTFLELVETVAERRQVPDRVTVALAADFAAAHTA